MLLQWNGEVAEGAEKVEREKGNSRSGKRSPKKEKK
jgi:hypothetical protein